MKRVRNLDHIKYIANPAIAATVPFLIGIGYVSSNAQEHPVKVPYSYEAASPSDLSVLSIEVDGSEESEQEEQSSGVEPSILITAVTDVSTSSNIPPKIVEADSSDECTEASQDTERSEDTEASQKVHVPLFEIDFRHFLWIRYQLLDGLDSLHTFHDTATSTNEEQPQPAESTEVAEQGSSDTDSEDTSWTPMNAIDESLYNKAVNSTETLPEALSAVRASILKLGKPYSQITRDSGNAYDCSSLVYWSYRDAGVNIDPIECHTAASIAQYLTNTGKTISGGDLQPGDLIFYSYEHNGRYMNISHVAMVIEGGLQIQASSTFHKVMTCGIDLNKAVLVARPVTESTEADGDSTEVAEDMETQISDDDVLTFEKAGEEGAASNELTFTDSGEALGPAQDMGKEKGTEAQLVGPGEFLESTAADSSDGSYIEFDPNL